MHTTSSKWTKLIHLDGSNLPLEDLILVSRSYAKIEINWELAGPAIERSRRILDDSIAENRTVYGVNTGFGSRADKVFSISETGIIQKHLIQFLQCGTGPELDESTVRLAMTILVHNLLKGHSGVRKEVIERYVFFLNEGVTAVVRELGSIGASGDLVPMAKITAVVCGLDLKAKCHFKGKVQAVSEVYDQLSIAPLKLQAKEGLSLVNNTCMHTAVAIEAVVKWKNLFGLSWATHLLMLEALEANLQPFEHSVQFVKPHLGQTFVARRFREMANGSHFFTHETQPDSRLIQDRYSIRCIPQFLGPQLDGLREVYRSVLIESNSVTDNPIVDPFENRLIQSGNFLGQYIAQGMDRLRYEIGLVAKHLDVQIATLMTKEFSKGLNPSLSGDSNNAVDMGLKGLQITANAVMPLLQFYGNSISDRFPGYAEEFNQNINSQAMNSAQLARKSIDLFENYLAIALIFAIQAAGIRMKLRARTTSHLSSTGKELFEMVHSICGVREPILNHTDSSSVLEEMIDKLVFSLRESKQLFNPVLGLLQEIDSFLES